ncbi:hypothetical protein L210DRAFT_3589665, partial [Boletus edulis BED1]
SQECVGFLAIENFNLYARSEEICDLQGQWDMISLAKGSDDREHTAISLMTPRTSRSRRVIKLGKDVDEYRVTGIAQDPLTPIGFQPHYVLGNAQRTKNS